MKYVSTTTSTQSQITIQEMVTMGLLAALLLVAQLALAIIPNVELVSFLIIVYTLVYKKKSFLIIYAFVLLEGFVHGIGIWWFSYLYIWPLLAVVTLVFQKNSSPLFWAIVSAWFGFAFGALCAIPYLITGGPTVAFAYWVSGLIFDCFHGIGNFVLMLVLFRPMYSLLSKLNSLHTHR